MNARKRIFGALGAALCLTLAGACYQTDTACTEIAMASVNVTLVDELGERVAGADVQYTVDGGASDACEEQNAGSYACGWELAGHFQITTNATGYDTDVFEVDVTEGECHVEPQTVQRTLSSLACTTQTFSTVVVDVTDVQGAEVTNATVEYSLFDSTDPAMACEQPLPGNQWTCGYEVQGDLRIDITHPTYEPFFTVVTVPADECHVITQQVSAVLEFPPD